jgi:flagellar protein FliO/FliZ
VKAGRDPHVPSAGLTSVAALTLASGRSVHLVRAGNDYVLLASAEHGLVPIHRYTEEQAREAGLAPSQEMLARSPLEPHDDPAGTGHDPMRMPAPGRGLMERLRDLTVRR